MYAPRRRLMYLGNIEAMSIPPEMAFPAMLIPNCAMRNDNAANRCQRGVSSSALPSEAG